MKIVLLFVLLGMAAGAYLDTLKDLRSLLKSKYLETKHPWDISSQLKKRNPPPTPAEDHSRSDMYRCFNIYSCPGFQPSSPSGSRETGYTFSMNMFEEVCNFSRALIQCYAESEFYQSCEIVRSSMQHFNAYANLCEGPAREALAELIPCMNQKALQDDIVTAVTNLHMNGNGENSNTCELAAEAMRAVFMTIGSHCTALQFMAALTLNQIIPVNSFMGSDVSSC